MIKIFKNMIPYWKWLIVIILLLVVQVYCDLSLPQYTSDIIDVGIQNRGLTHILPEQMTSQDYEMAQLFMTSQEREAFAACYTMEDQTYIRSTNDHEVLDSYDEEFLVPLVMIYQFNTARMSAASGTESDFTMTEEQQALIAMLESGTLSDEMILEIRSSVSEQIETLGSSTLKSMGIAFAAYCDENAQLDLDQVQMSYMWSTGGKMLLIALIMMLCSAVVGYCASRVGAGVGRDLRIKTFCNVVEYSNAEMDKFSTASLITRSTNDIQQIQMVTAVFLRMVLMAPIMGVGGIIKVAQTGAGMEWIIALAVLLMLGLVGTLVSITMPKFKIMQTLVDKVNLVSREILTGLSVIRAFGREKKEEERFDEANRNLMKTQLFTNRVMTCMMPGMTMVMYGITLLIVWVGAKRIDAGYMQVGTLTAFITYTMMIVMSFLMLTAMSIMLPRAGVAAERIDEVIRTRTSIEEAQELETLPDPKGVLRFSHVGFTYPEAKEEVISDIDFTAEPGKTTAIIGSTGCGKSTLVHLIPRFYDVTEGSITIDDVDIRQLSLKELRNMIGFVPQKGILFSGTIASNLRFGNPDATDEEIAKAAEIAQAKDFVEEKPKGYESEIAQGGTNVSGGQKQRLAIARAIAKNPKIYVFDDSFSALDMKTDAKLRKALEEKTKDATVLIVAQRISTILKADQILVLDDGKIVGKGTHEELLKNCEVYEQIARSQLSAKELGLEEK
jgi:ATP-binding cassette subfamily B protein